MPLRGEESLVAVSVKLLVVVQPFASVTVTP
jgi:hypothetical protein